MAGTRKSIYGKFLQVEKSTSGGPLGEVVASVGIKTPQIKFGSDGSEAKVTGLSTPEAATSTGETLGSGGFYRLAPSSAAVYTLPTPAGTGKRLSLFQDSASTSVTVTISSANGSIQTTNGSSMFNAILKARGAGVEFVDMSTQWAAINVRGTTDSIHFTS